MSPSCFSRQDVHHSVYLLLQKIGIARPLGRVFPSGGGARGDPPMSSMSPPSLLVMTKFFLDIFQSLHDKS